MSLVWTPEPTRELTKKEDYGNHQFIRVPIIIICITNDQLISSREKQSRNVILSFTSNKFPITSRRSTPLVLIIISGENNRFGQTATFSVRDQQKNATNTYNFVSLQLKAHSLSITV